MDATSAQTLNFNVTGGLSTGAVHVWSTNVNSNNPADYFVHASDITPSGGNYSLTVQPGYVYTITTTTGQAKGTATSRRPGASPCPTATTSTPTPPAPKPSTWWTGRAPSRWLPAAAAAPASACAR